MNLFCRHQQQVGPGSWHDLRVDVARLLCLYWDARSQQAAILYAQAELVDFLPARLELNLM